MRISDWSSDVCSSDLRLRAADLMEAAAADIEARGGRFTIIGTDRSMSFEEVAAASADPIAFRSEEHTSELQSLMRISYAVFCLKKKKTQNDKKKMSATIKQHEQQKTTTMHTVK